MNSGTSADGEVHLAIGETAGAEIKHKPAGRCLTASELVPPLMETEEGRLSRLRSGEYSALHVVPLLGFAMKDERILADVDREFVCFKKRILRLQFAIGEVAPDGTAGAAPLRISADEMKWWRTWTSATVNNKDIVHDILADVCRTEVLCSTSGGVNRIYSCNKV